MGAVYISRRPRPTGNKPAGVGYRWGARISPDYPNRSPKRRMMNTGGWIRTNDLQVMSLTSCYCSTPANLYNVKVAILKK